MSVVFNPFTGKLDFIGAAGTAAGGGTIAELTADPGTPTTSQVWVLRTDPAEDGNIGEFRIPGLLMLYAGTLADPTYNLSYYTEAGNIKRTSIT